MLGDGRRGTVELAIVKAKPPAIASAPLVESVMSDRVLYTRPIAQAVWVAGERSLVLGAFAVLIVAMLVPVFSFQIPPMADYVNHLARMHVIAVGADDAQLARFYDVKWQVIPNLVMDATVPFLARLIGTYAAGQVFVALNLLAIVGGVMALHRAIYGRLSPWPLVCFLFLYNHALIYGFMNFVFASAIALWALAAWIHLRERHPLVRGAVSSLFAVSLFFCHLFGIGMYGLGLLAYEGWRLLDRREAGWFNLAAVARDRARLKNGAIELAVLGMPFLPTLGLMLVSPTMGLASDVSWDWNAKFDGLGWLVQAYGHGVDTAFGLALAVALGIGLITRTVRLHPAGALLLGLGFAIYVAMPTVLFGSWAADLRLPVALIFMAIAFADLNVTSQAAKRLFVVAVIALALTRFIGVGEAWAEIDQSFADMRSSLRFIDAGSKVLVSTANKPTGTEEMNLPLSHAACLAMIERSSLVTTAFAVAGKQILNVRPDYRAIADVEDGEPPNVAALITAARAGAQSPPVTGYWRQWADRYDFVYVLYTAPGDANPMPDHLELLYDGINFQLYEVIPPVRPDIVR